MNKDEILKKFPIKEKVLYIAQVGSFLYGTNSKQSDTDIKAIFLPDLSDLILKTAPNHYNFNTKNNYQKNTKDDIDITFFSLQYFLDLASKGETNSLDLLFSFTNKDAIIFKDELWDELISGIENVITKNVNAYLGYCKSQSIKYSIRGEKLNNFNAFFDFCKIYFDVKDSFGAPITLESALERYMFIDINKIPKPNDERKVIYECLKDNQNFDFGIYECSKNNAKFDFGSHAYFLTAENKESYLQISDIKFQLKDSIKSSYHKVLKVINSYGTRSANAAADNGADFKALSHAIRVLFQTEELLQNGIIEFPVKQRDFIKSIKYKQTEMKYDDIVNFITERIDYIDKEIIKISKLRDKADYEWIKKYILNCYKKVYNVVF